MSGISLTDPLGNKINLDKPAQRIVSLVPSQTELLHDLGLTDQVLGITKFCVHPADWRKNKSIVGGTKNQHLERIHELNPDLVIANKEENTKQLIEKLSVKYQIYVSDIATLEDAYHMMQDLGVLTGTEDQAVKIVNTIKDGFKNLRNIKEKKPTLKVAYCIWKEPWMWAGNDTFISHLLSQCGFENILLQTRYPELDQVDIKKESPDYIFLSSEPYPFQQKHIDELKKNIPNTKIILVDGEYFSWYGSRLVKAPLYFISLLKQIHSNTL